MNARKAPSLFTAMCLALLVLPGTGQPAEASFSARQEPEGIGAGARIMAPGVRADRTKRAGKSSALLLPGFPYPDVRPSQAGASAPSISAEIPLGETSSSSGLGTVSKAVRSTTGSPVSASSPEPVTALATQQEPSDRQSLISPGRFSLEVVGQPHDQPGYVSSVKGTVTRFDLAADYGAIGLLAHNYASGELFDDVQVGEYLFLTAGDGTRHAYQVHHILRFAALTPTDPRSDFVEIASGKRLTAGALFDRTYGVSGQLVLQTCIADESIDSMGRLFVLASPTQGGNPGAAGEANPEISSGLESTLRLPFVH
jgi:hypothetical protein